MGTRMQNWFECKIRYGKTFENGLVKKVTECYLVDALTFTEAENRILEELRPFISGDCTVADIKRANVAEVFDCADEAADRWYKCKTVFLTVDERSGKEKRINSYMLVQAGSLRDALNRLDEGMRGSMQDWEVTSVVETSLMDVYPYKADGTDDETKALTDVARVTVEALPETLDGGDVPSDAIRDFSEGLKEEDPLLMKVAAYLKEKGSIGRPELGMAFHIGVKRVSKIVSQLLVRGLIEKDCSHTLTFAGHEE